MHIARLVVAISLATLGSALSAEPLSDKIRGGIKDADAKLGEFVDALKQAGIRKGTNYPIFIHNRTKEKKTYDMYGTHCNVSNGGPSGYTSITFPPKSTTQFSARFEEFCTFTMDDEYVSSWRFLKGRYFSVRDFEEPLNIEIRDDGIYIGTKKYERYYPEKK